MPTITSAATRASGDDQHDHEDQRERGHDRDHQVIFGAVGHVLVGRGRPAQNTLWRPTGTIASGPPGRPFVSALTRRDSFRGRRIAVRG